MISQSQEQHPQQQSSQEQQIVTPFYTVRTENNGRRLVLDIHGDIKDSKHAVAVTNYCRRLKERGLKFNADHVPFETCKDFKMSCYDKRFDIVFEENGKRTGVEIKTYGDVGTQRTAEQLRMYALCVQNNRIDRVIFLVPQDEYQNAREILRFLQVEYAISLEAY